SAPNIAKLTSIYDRFVFVWIPSCLTYFFVFRDIIPDKDVLMMSDRFTIEIHINQNRISQTYELSGINIPIDLWVLCELTIDYVFSGELSFIFIETVGDENRNIIRPR